MSLVTLVSGGIDSSLMAVMARQEGIELFPLFIDYGQLGLEREWAACTHVHASQGLPEPFRMNLSGFGKAIVSGITDSQRDIFDDAFLPGRNFLFLLAGSAYAFQISAGAVAIGLLNEDTHLFPDQTLNFLSSAENSISLSLGKKIKIIAPLMEFHKSDVLLLRDKFGIENTYSCHRGEIDPCGKCISCLEILTAQEQEV